MIPSDIRYFAGGIHCLCHPVALVYGVLLQGPGEITVLDTGSDTAWVPGEDILCG